MFEECYSLNFLEDVFPGIAFIRIYFLKTYFCKEIFMVLIEGYRNLLYSKNY